MDTAAFVLSIVAILAAAGSAWYTREQARQAREQARQAKRSADIDAERRADEVAAQQRAELETKRANLRLRVEREDNVDGSIDEGPFIHSIVVTNDGPAEAGEVELEIVSAWNNQMGTRASFAGGQRHQRVGRLPAHHREVLRLEHARDVDYSDIGECHVNWRDGTSPGVQNALMPARPDWL